MVPMLTCGLERSNFAFSAIGISSLKRIEFGYNSPANTELHCKTILLNLSCKIKCFYRKFCRSYTTPAKSLSVFQRSALGAACDDLISDVLRHRLVVRRLHDILATALSLGTQVGGVAEHLSQRNESVDTLSACHCLHALDLATASVQIADDIAQILIRNDNSNLHDGLGDDGVSLAHSVLEGHRTCNGEGHFRGVDLMIRTIPQGDLDINNRIACQNASLHSTLNTVVDSRDVFLRDSAANDSVDELVTLVKMVTYLKNSLKTVRT